MRVVLFSGAAIALALSLAGCGAHQSAVQGQSGQAATAPSSTGGVSTSEASVEDKRYTPVPKVNGKPLWAPNRKHTAEENAAYQFTKNGSDFGAKTEAEYVTKVHAFVDSPPANAETLDRNNGDRLIYDAKDNTFAVVSRDGAPRTMFKPRDGAAYWNEQKDRESKRDKGGSDGGGGNQS